MAFQLDNKTKKSSKESSFDIDSLLKKEINIFGSSFSNKKKEAFYIELSVLLNAGLELKDALELIGAEQKKEADKKIFALIVEELISGRNLSDAIKKQKHFTEYEYYSVQIGERTGTLNKVFEDLGVFYQRKNEQRRLVVNAFSYPIVVVCTAMLALIFMLRFVVPMFADIFKQNKVELPWITQKIIILSNTFGKYYGFVFLFIFAFIIAVNVFKNKLWYKKLYTSILLKIPFVGNFVRKIKIAQFTQAITLLVSAKVPLLNGIQLTEKMIDFYPLQRALKRVEEGILQGKSLHESISSESIFDPKMGSLIRVAEETNQVETIFNRLTYQYTQEIEHKSKMLSATVEPLMILVLGAIVATILVAMYLPMFKLSTVIG